MEELIKIQSKEGELLVSGRELHEGLEIKTPFHKWIIRMLEYGFEENIDYFVTDIFVPNSKGGKQYQKDYVLKIDMAKEISMIQRNEKGRMYRKYFISCEKKLKETSQTPALSLPDNLKKEIEEFKEEADYIRSQVHIKKNISNLYVRTIKNHLGISTISEDKYGYEFIRDLFFTELGVSKFEDIPVNKENMLLLNECCKSYKRSYEQISIFDEEE